MKDNVKEIEIDLKSEYKIKIENVDEFNDSIFKDIYISAKRNVNEIVKNNGTSDRYDSYNNVIAFTGERGKGKSSAMLSFLNGLSSVSSGNQKDNFFEEFYSDHTHANVKYKFISLDVIDPSLYRGNERLIEIVLAKMFSKFKSILENDHNRYSYNVNDDNRRTLIKLFQVVFDNLKYTKGNNKEDLYNQDALDALIKLSTSSNLRDSFIELTNNFLNVFKDGAKDENFLVITIDDFDLKIDGVYEMLEDLRQFLISQRIIVLIACKIEQMREAVHAAIYSQYIKMVGSNPIMVDRIFEEKEIQVKALKYIEKLFPNKSTIILKDIFNLDLTKIIKGVETNFSNDINHAVLGILYQKQGLFFSKNEFNNFISLDNTLRSLSSFNMVISKSSSEFKYFIKNEILRKELTAKQIEQLNILFESKANLLKANFINSIAQEFKAKTIKGYNYLLYPKNLSNISFSDCNTIFYLLEDKFNIYDLNYRYIEYLKFTYSLNLTSNLNQREYLEHSFENYTFVNLENLELIHRLKKSDFYRKCFRDTFQTSFRKDDIKEDLLIKEKLIISSLISHLGPKDKKFRNEDENIYERKRLHFGKNFDTYQFSIFELFVSIYKTEFISNRIYNNIDEREINALNSLQEKYQASKYYNLFLNPFFVSEFYKLFVFECNNLNKHKKDGFPKYLEEIKNEPIEDYHQILIDFFKLGLKTTFDKLNSKYPYLELDYDTYIDLNRVIKILIYSQENTKIKEFINNAIKFNVLPSDENFDLTEIVNSAATSEIKEFLNYLENTARIYQTTVDKLIENIRFKDSAIGNYLKSFSIQAIKDKKEELIDSLNEVISNINGNGQS